MPEITNQMVIEALLKRIHLPREWGASYEAVSTPGDDWLEIWFANGDKWKLTVEKVKRG